MYRKTFKLLKCLLLNTPRKHNPWLMRDLLIPQVSTILLDLREYPYLAKCMLSRFKLDKLDYLILFELSHVSKFVNSKYCARKSLL